MIGFFWSVCSVFLVFSVSMVYSTTLRPQKSFSLQAALRFGIFAAVLHGFKAQAGAGSQMMDLVHFASPISDA
jgi:hypothetical protein